MLWIVTVEATDKDGNGDYYEAAVLSHTEQGARRSATKATAKLGLTGVHSVEARVVDPYKLGVVAVGRRV